LAGLTGAKIDRCGARSGSSLQRGPEVVVGDDRVANAKDRLTGHDCLIVPGPGGTSVFGDDVGALGGVGVGLLIAVGSAGEDESVQLVTMGRNLGAGRMHTA
jgi:hypothetical protein